MSRARSLLNIFTGSSSKPKEDPDVIISSGNHNHYEDGKPVPYNQRKTLAELQALRRKKDERKRDAAKKNKAEGRMKSIWTIDSELCNNLDLEFRSHGSVIQLHALPISRETEPDSVKLSCLAMF